MTGVLILRAARLAVLDDPRTKERFSSQGIIPLRSSAPSDYADYVNADIARWKEATDKAKLKPE
jgi:tripartite-type tricarboxylate transporter receptor subunit TctC